MERLLHICKFRKSHNVPIGKYVGLAGAVCCKPNYKADEIELIPASLVPDYPTRKNYLNVPLRKLTQRIDTDFYDRVTECCELFLTKAQAAAMADDIIDYIRVNGPSISVYSMSTTPAIIDLFQTMFDSHGVEIPRSKNAAGNWQSILSGRYALDIEEFLKGKTEITRYGGYAHTKNIVVPPHIASRLDWEGKSVGLYARDGKYIVKLARPQDLVFQKSVGKLTTSEGRVHLGRYLYLTKRQRTILGMAGGAYFHEGYMAKMTIDMVGVPVLTVTKATKSDLAALPRFKSMLQTLGYDDFYAEKREVIVRVVNNIKLPAPFIESANLTDTEEEVATVMKDHTLYIFGRESTCSFTGDRIFPDKQTVRTVPVCPDCAEHTDDVRDRILNDGGIREAVQSAQEDLAKMLVELKNLERSL